MPENIIYVDIIIELGVLHGITNFFKPHQPKQQILIAFLTLLIIVRFANFIIHDEDQILHEISSSWPQQQSISRMVRTVESKKKTELSLCNTVFLT
mmetsp:Transcript_22646/g.46001  ORF Transcript_22646/g.46001 Transcript_22646/m.46001 type:complete len:96 (-) Transcript_22646:984-1271(-)